LKMSANVLFALSIGLLLVGSCMPYDPAAEIATKARQFNLGNPRPETPTIVQTPPPQNIGWFQHFDNGSVYWSPDYGAKVIRGAIFSKWGSTGWEQGALGFPISDELPAHAPAGPLRGPFLSDTYTLFQNGMIYLHTNTNEAVVCLGERGILSKDAPQRAITDRAKKLNLGNPSPTTPVAVQTPPPRDQGWFQHFEPGSVYFTVSYGAHLVKGLIFRRWGELRWEQGPLGFPITDETAVPAPYGNDRYSFFEGGAIYWHANTGQAVECLNPWWSVPRRHHPTETEQIPKPWLWGWDRHGCDIRRFGRVLEELDMVFPEWVPVEPTNPVQTLEGIVKEGDPPHVSWEDCLWPSGGQPRLQSMFDEGAHAFAFVDEKNAGVLGPF
jgi:hypothetical protein